MERGKKQRERRRHVRQSVLGTVSVRSADGLHGTFRVRDLSAGGARLAGTLPVPPGREVTAVLRLPRRPALTFSARVIRHERNGSAATFSLAFVGVSPEDEDAIHEALVAALERQEAREGATVLALYGDGEDREALERELEALDVSAIVVSSPVDALSHLDRPDTPITVVLVDVSVGASQAMDLLDFVGTYHPQVRRIAIADEFHPFRLEAALRSGRAHAVLRRPFARGLLRATMSGHALA